MNEQFVKSPQPTAKRLADIDGPDFYPTPRWATKALLNVESFQGKVWECACGDGAMSEEFIKQGYLVESSDLYDRGYGTSKIDFLNSDKKSDNIVTNPPYNSAEKFVLKSLELAQNKFALLLRLAFLESAQRHRSIFSLNPPTKVWVFSERITFYPKGAVVKGSGTTAYAWYVWDMKSLGAETRLGWLPLGLKTQN